MRERCVVAGVCLAVSGRPWRRKRRCATGDGHGDRRGQRQRWRGAGRGHRGRHQCRDRHQRHHADERRRHLHRPQSSSGRVLAGGRTDRLHAHDPKRRHPAGGTGRPARCHAAAGPGDRVGRSGRRGLAAGEPDLVARRRDRPAEDRRPAAERPRLQPAGAALARRAADDAAPRQRQLQGRLQRQRQPHVQQRVPARWRRQHLVLQLVPRRERAAGAALGRCAAGVQDPDQRLLGGVRAQLRGGGERDDQVGHQRHARDALRVPPQRQRSTPTTSSRMRSGRRSRSAGATSSAPRSAARW